MFLETNKVGMSQHSLISISKHKYANAIKKDKEINLNIKLY